MKTIDQVRKELNYRGESITAWARKNGFNPESVKKVLHGKSKCSRGSVHEIAVKLGIKDGIIIK